MVPPENIVYLVPERPEQQRNWVVRASGGDFTRHFLRYGLVAIGHIDILQLPEGGIPEDVLENLEDRLKLLDPERARSSITSHANQVRAFCSQIQVGDLVLTVNSSRSLIIGRIVGDAFVARGPLAVEDSYGGTYLMRSQLRRAVEWGPILHRRELPASFEMTMLAHQAVFNVDAHWESIYHLIYPCFRCGDRLYLSANIRTEGAIDNFAISQLFAILTGLEFAVRTFGREMPAINSSEALDEKIIPNLTTKAEFRSPGNVWATVFLNASEWLPCVLIYVMIFGGKVPHILETDGLIDKEMRHKILMAAGRLVTSFSFQKVRQLLRLDVPRADTTALGNPPDFGGGNFYLGAPGGDGETGQLPKKDG